MLNQATYDSLATKPFLPEDNTSFLVLPDYLHPILTQDLDRDDFSDKIAPEMRDILLTDLDGSHTLNFLGGQYGQPLLDLIGTMHQEGVVEFT
jgi:hypothetical protein